MRRGESTPPYGWVPGTVRQNASAPAADAAGRQGDAGSVPSAGHQCSGSIGRGAARGDFVHLLSGFPQIRAVHNGGAIARIDPERNQNGGGFSRNRRCRHGCQNE